MLFSGLSEINVSVVKADMDAMNDGVVELIKLEEEETIGTRTIT